MADTEPVCLIVHLLIRAGAEARAAECLQALARATRTEPGCRMYNVHRSLDEPRRFALYELYRDDAALEAHRHSPHFTRYASGELAGLVEERRLDLYAPVAVAE